jgi:phenylalanyl-tRNA synthetase beta chain
LRAPLSWIREFTPLDASPADIADALNQLGLEVDAVDAPGAEINGVVVARILHVVPHPDADKIRLADITFGDGRETRVVCGAPNIEPGMVVPFATVGARLPGDFVITKRKIRGVVSEGMLCSSRELGLGDDHDGILVLADDAPLGVDVRTVLGLDDIVFDLSITPNRPDAMGIVGIARDLAAHFGLPFAAAVPEAEPSLDQLGDVRVVVEAEDRCPRFVARIAGVTMGTSPEWMQRRLRLAGMRPISNVVDVTNYILLERCRPLHAFDLGRLGGRGIVVRLAEPDEHMTTLDGVERVLSPHDLLICDAHRSPQAIAGIMGGRDGEVDDTTTEVLIESAYFEPSGISRSSKRLGIRSEASARFERGIDPNGTADGANLAIALLEQIADGRAVAGAIDCYPTPIERPKISVRTARINKILGTHLDADTVRDLLRPLDIDIAGYDDDFVVACPTHRPDLTREIDIVEEVARRVGLQNIERTVASAPAGSVGRLTAEQRDRRLIADTLVGAGLCEGMTMPLIAPSDLERVGLAAAGVVEVTNPLRSEESLLRTSLRPGLLGAIAGNAARGEPEVALFELGTVFGRPLPGNVLPNERVMVAGASAGREVTVGDAVDLVRSIEAALRLEPLALAADALDGLHPGRGARVLSDVGVVGVVGQIAPAIAAAHGVEPVVWFELDVGALLASARRSPRFRPVSTYPPVNIDLAFVLADAVPAADVAATIQRSAGELLERCALFDEFRSDAFGEGRRSLAFALRFRAIDRTLTDLDVAPLRQTAIDAVITAHDATLRG